jgi:hypothetical protein
MTARAKVTAIAIGVVMLAGLAGASQERAPERKADPTPAGKWAALIDSPHGKMPVRFELKLDGQAVTGTFSTEQLGALPLKGQYVDGKLTFSITGGPGELEFAGKLKDPSSISGIISSHAGDLVVNATRVPEK